MDKAAETETINLVRLSSWEQLKRIMASEGEKEEIPLEWGPRHAYERDENGRLSPVFLLLLGEDTLEESRFYIDHNPNWDKGNKEPRESAAYEKAQADHDDEDTEYLDFGENGENDIFDYDIFIEVKTCQQIT